MNTIFLSNNKVSKHKLEPFKQAQSMYKWSAGLVYLYSFINYLLYLPAPFPRGQGIDLKGSSTFLQLMLSMYIDRLGMFSHFYGTLLNCLSACLGSWAGAVRIPPYVK